MSTTEERVVLSVEARDQLTAPLQDMAKQVEKTADRVAKAGTNQASAVDKAMKQISGGTAGAVASTQKLDRAFSQATGNMSSTAGRAGQEIGNAMSGSVDRAMRSVTSSVDSTYRDVNGRLRDANGRFIRTAQEAGREAGQRSGDGFSGGFGKGLGSFKGMLGGITAAVAAVGFGSLIAEATRASDATDKFIATMGFAGLDTSAIDKAKKAAQEYADQTVYDLPTIQNMLAQLASNGVKDYTGLTKAAGNLNAVAGGNAETFKSVAMVMTQTAGAGKLTTENWNQLADAIPGAAGPIMKALEKAGAYTGNFRDAMSKGEITAEEFNKALMELGTKPVAVEAAKSTKTFEGAIGNLNATINGGLMKAMDAIKPAATGAISALADGLGGAIAWTEKAAKGLHDLFVKGDFTGAFREAFNVEEDSPLVALLFNIREGAIGLYDLIIKGDYQGMLRKVFGWEEDSKAVDLLLDMRDAAMKLPDVLKDLAGKGADVVKWLWDMREPITIIAGLILTLLIPRLVQLGIEALKSAAQQKLAWIMAQGAATKAQIISVFAAWQIIGGWVLMASVATINAVKIAASWLVAMGPVGWIIGLIALLVAGFVWAYNNVGWFKDGVDAAMRWVQQAFQNVVDWWNSDFMPALTAVGQWFADVFDGVSKFLSDTFTNVSNWFRDFIGFFVDGWGMAVDGAEAAGKWLGEVFTQIGNWFRDFIGFFVDGWGMLVDFYNGVLFPIIRTVGDVFAAVFDWVQRLIWNFMTIAAAIWTKLVDLWNGVLFPALQTLGDFFMTIFRWIWDNAIKPVVDFIVGGFHGLIDFWNGVFIPGVQAVGNFLQTVFNWIWLYATKPVIDFVVGGFNWLITFWNTVFIPGLQAVGTFIGEVFNWIWTFLIKPVVDFIVNGFLGLIDFWNGVFIPGLQAVGDFIGSVFTWLWENGIKPVVDFIVGGFNGLVDFWNGVLLPAAEAVGKWFSDVIGGAISGIGDFIDDLVKGFNGFITFWTDTLKPVVDTIADIFNSIGDAIGYALGKLGEFANNPLGGIQDWLGIQKDENGQGKMPGASGGMVAGFSGGGIARFAGGGIIPGYAPGVDNIPAILSRGEGVAVPELVRAIGPANFMALNAEYSGGRPAGSGPSPALAAAVGGRGSTSTMTVERGAVNISVQVAEGGTVTATDMEAIKEAVEEVFNEMERRGY